MKERKTLAKRLLDSVRKSATKGNPKAKKGLARVLRARGMSKKQVRATTKKAFKQIKEAAKRPEERTAMDKALRLARMGSQLRVTRR